MSAWLLGAGEQPVIGLVLLSAVAAVVGSASTVAGALGSAAVCWACYDGFVVHRFGELGVGSGELAALALMLGLALAASTAARVI